MKRWTGSAPCAARSGASSGRDARRRRAHACCDGAPGGRGGPRRSSRRAEPQGRVDDAHRDWRAGRRHAPLAHQRPAHAGLPRHRALRAWITVGSMLSWLSIADLGLGNGLTNALAKARAEDDQQAAREAVSTSIFFVGAMSLAMALVFAAAFSFVPWHVVFAVSIASGAPALRHGRALRGDLLRGVPAQPGRQDTPATRRAISPVTGRARPTCSR